MAELVNVQMSILKKLHCSYCNHYLSCGPVRCNSEGMGICGRCMPNKEDADMVVRNLSYEAAVENTRFPCIYDKYGCKMILLFNKVTTHESNCLFKPILCASLTLCKWQGPTLSIFDHFSFRHRNLFLDKNTYKIDVKKAVSQNLITKEDDVVVLIRFIYNSNDKMLFMDGVHFSDQNIEMFCKVSLINGTDSDYLLILKPFKCDLYLTKSLDPRKAQRIPFATILPALQNPEIVVVKISLNVDKKYCLPACIDEISLEQLKCSECYIYMVPPIVTCNNKNFCKNCYPSGLDNNDLEMYAKQAQYPCCWYKCQFVGTYENIRLHETVCQFASIKCPLSRDCLVAINTAVEHLENHHACKWFHNKITIDYNPTAPNDKYYCWVGEQVVILYLMQMEDRYNYITGAIYFYVLFQSKNSDFAITYHFNHLHCKTTSVSKCIKQNLNQNNTIAIKVPKLPKCFGDENYSIEIKITEPESV